MIWGYNDDQYQESTLRSIECAKNITASQRTFCRWPALRPWSVAMQSPFPSSNLKCIHHRRFSKAWILRAVLVLIVDWAASINRAHPVELIASKRLYAAEASELFLPNSQDKTPLMSKQCAGIIEALLRVGDQRAAGRLSESSVHPAKEIEDFFEGVSAALRSGAGKSPFNFRYSLNKFEPVLIDACSPTTQHLNRQIQALIYPTYRFLVGSNRRIQG